MERCFWLALVGAFATGLGACSPGYMKASELESKHQGPADCEARCVELGMRMGALVLVSDTLPGCVCLPKPAAPKPGSAEPVAPPAPEAAEQGASAATTSYVFAMAAAVSARTVQTQQQKTQQQNYIPQ